MVDLDDERDVMCIATGDRTEHAECRGHGIAAAFDRQLDDVFRIEINGVRSEGRAGAVFDSLIDGEDGHVARSCQPAGIVNALHAAEHARIAVTVFPHAVDKVRTGEVQCFFRDTCTRMVEQRICFGAQHFLKFVDHDGSAVVVRKTG